MDICRLCVRYAAEAQGQARQQLQAYDAKSISILALQAHAADCW